MFGILRELASRPIPGHIPAIWMNIFGKMLFPIWFEQINLKLLILKLLARPGKANLRTYYCDLDEYIWKDVVFCLNKLIFNCESSNYLLFLNQSSIWASLAVFFFQDISQSWLVPGQSVKRPLYKPTDPWTALKELQTRSFCFIGRSIIIYLDHYYWKENLYLIRSLSQPPSTWRASSD